MSYFSEHKSGLLKLGVFFFCLLVMFVLGTIYSEGRGKEEFNDFVNDIDKNSHYYLYDTSSKAKKGKQWIDDGSIGSLFYGCLKNSQVRTSGGASNTYKRFMVIKGYEQDYLLKLTIFDGGKVYFITYQYFKEYGLGTIRTNESTGACSLPTKQSV